ncbi:exopolysaccharide biosynthesis polyprenyl glycosylphosphotransferase [Vulcanococcus sp.]|jgi:exopolysaccharide biosynthesis polyprenyl glycosylphosphotransferase|uniref:exopolysaccharide biosynthesis polyprenyl glycosylphosphotransferase n=1 Tax=Vulcanococcus sp. TaxID=2856995 RepID=UPI0037D99ED7
MPWARHRIPLLTAALLDAVGLVGLAMLNGVSNGQLVIPQSAPLLVLVLIYCSLGWLFGSYTLLKLKTLAWTQMLARLGSTALASIAAAAVFSYLFRLQITSDLFFRSNLIPLFVLLSLWSAAVRLLLRRLRPSKPQGRWHIVALPSEISSLAAEWRRSLMAAGPLPEITELSSGSSATQLLDGEALALSAGVINDAALQRFCQEAVNRGQAVFSVVELAEQELQRIPTRWIDNQWLLFSASIDGQRTSLQKQLKRYADVLVSLLLLLLSAPLLLLALALVKLHDGGAVIYRQQRSGLLGQPFNVLKIRTMSLNAEAAGAQWAQTNDQRITPVGYWLRRTRLDELPQLINVLRGEMSLIGPRPERPDLEQILEQQIPNYKLRHWMRPGLSGWAQVNMPYASSIEDSELKLSYDLFYLRNASLWLDLLILFKTIKIVLKAAGR